MINQDAAMRSHPTITTMLGDEAWDSAGNPVVIDQSLVDAAAAEIQAELDATQYQRNRQPEYPSLATLADALYWSNQGDNTKLDEYYAACAAVKAKYPKPEVN
jgi:hypothetical protein